MVDSCRSGVVVCLIQAEKRAPRQIHRPVIPSAPARYWPRVFEEDFDNCAGRLAGHHRLARPDHYNSLFKNLVPTARLELAQLSPLPPQDSVSTNFTTSAALDLPPGWREEWLAGQPRILAERALLLRNRGRSGGTDRGARDDAGQRRRRGRWSARDAGDRRGARRCRR